jgi:hypothetical protein
MTGSKKPEQKPGSADALTKTSPEGSVELTESQLADASGGAIYMNQLSPTAQKVTTAHKIDSDPALLLPAVKPQV